MKRIYNRDNRLESHPLFSYAAWAVVIGFALFVYWMTNTVGAKIAAIETNTALMESQYLTPTETATIRSTRE